MSCHPLTVTGAPPGIAPPRTGTRAIPKVLASTFLFLLLSLRCSVFCICLPPSTNSAQTLIPLPSKEKGLPRLCLAMALGLEREGCFCCGREKGEKEPGSHFYMCWAQHRGNYSNSPTHTFDHPPYVGLEVLSLIVALLAIALLLKAVLVDAIIPLPSKSRFSSRYNCARAGASSFRR